VTVKVTRWKRDPLVALTVKLYVPALPVLNDSKTGTVLPDARVTSEGLSVKPGPDGLLEATSVTVPLKRLRLDTEIVVDTLAPAFVVRLCCGSVALKSYTLTSMLVDAENAGELDDAVSVIVALP